MRARLPDRRPNMTRDIDWQGRKLTVTVGFDMDALPKEVFASGAKEGSDMAATIADACVVISLALQHGATPEGLSRSLGRVPAFVDGAESDGPASVIGAVLAVVEEAI